MNIRHFVLMATAIILCGNIFAAPITYPTTEGSSSIEPRRYSDANIHGHIIDAKTNEHIPFVTISVKGTTIGTVADASGHFFLKNLPTGKHILVAEAVGYKSDEMEVEIIRNKSIELNFILQES